MEALEKNLYFEVYTYMSMTKFGELYHNKNKVKWRSYINILQLLLLKYTSVHKTRPMNLMKC